MYAFTYHRATGLRHAANLLEKSEDAKLLAGGQTLLPTMKQRLASPANIVDLDKIEGMAEISQAGRSITIGAMARHNDVHNSSVVQQAIPALAYLAGQPRRSRQDRGHGGDHPGRALDHDRRDGTAQRRA